MKKFNKKIGLFFKTIALFIWKISDFLLVLGALTAFTCGFFMLHRIAGVFAIGVSLIVLAIIVNFAEWK